ncbi:MAG: RNA methyltransferase PUA domain-containing protein, partial [Raoultibacter sp.]
MSLQHFFLEDQVLSAEVTDTFFVRLSDDDAKHARVLRLGVGEHIAIVDAVKDYFECEIT